VSREREALLACADLIDQIDADLGRLALALACLRAEVREAADPPPFGHTRDPEGSASDGPPQARRGRICPGCPT